jgi:GT2 family glycosyltransferase
VIPTRNNEDTIEKCLSSIQNLEFNDDFEVIIVDGYSIDRTVEIARNYGCKVVFEDKNTISYARNLGVKLACGELIAFIDADCVVDKNWLKELVKYFNDPMVASVGGPNLTPEDDTNFAKCVGDFFSLLSKLGTRYGFQGKEVIEIYHNPTCNSMYRKSILERVGGFNPKLVTCDDEDLDYRIRKLGYKILYTPYAKVLHYRRPTWRKFMKMAYNYGLGRMQIIKLHRETGKWFHFLPSASLFIFTVFAFLSLFSQAFLWLIVAILTITITCIIALSLILSLKNRKLRMLITYSGLFICWWLSWALGFLRGIT